MVVLSNFSEIREEQFWFEISLRVFIWPSKLLMFCRGKKLVFLMFYFLCLYVLTFLFFYVHMFLVLMFLFLMLLFLIFLCISYVVCFSCMTFLILLLIQGGSLIFVITNNSFARYKITYYYLKWCCWKQTCLFGLTLSSALFHSKLSFVHLVELAYDAIYFFWKEEDKKY